MKHAAAVPIAIAFALLAAIPPAFADNDKSDKGKTQGKPAESEDQQMRFKGMDKDHDGRISRAEWHGNDQSFSNHDRNHDGYIAGDELGQAEGPVDGGPVPARTPAPNPVPTPAPNPVPTPFGTLDHNKDGKVSQLEWDGSPEAFRRLDLNHDGVLGPKEYPSPTSPSPAPVPSPAPTTFATLDLNKDGKISQLEWDGTPETFKRLDVNHDMVLGPKEFASGTPSAPGAAQLEFAKLDLNNDGKISQLEWDGTPETFKRLDVNHDMVLGPKEFASGTPSAPSAAQLEFAKLDLNNDGKISQLEWDGTPETFKRLDVNHDMVLGPKEFASGTPSAPGAAQLEFAKLDLNKDGKISQLEWDGTPETFKRLDVNHDMVLGPKEFASGTPSAPSAAQLEFAKLDLNNDGKISQLEWKSDPASFKNLDVNHDGVLGPKEFSGEVQGALHPMFAKLDLNKDGKISSAEWTGGTQSFSHLDLNRDGWLSPQEYPH